MHAKPLLTAIGLTLVLGMCSCQREVPRGPDEQSSYQAEGVDLRMGVIGTEIGLSGLVELVFEIEHLSDVEVEIAPSDHWRGDFELYSLDEAPGRMVDGGRGIIRRVVYLLEPPRAGTFVVDQIRVDTWQRDQPLLRERLLMDPFSVQVTSRVFAMVEENTDAADILDIDGPWVSPESKHYWGVLAWGTLLCGGFLLWIKFRKAPKPAFEHGLEAAPDAGEIALRELTQLFEERLCEQGLFDPFFVRLSDIVRRYIESRFERPVISQTTEEFLAALAPGEVFDCEQEQKLAAYFQQWDRVKFAGIDVTPEAATVSGENCRCFVAATRGETA